MTRQNRRAPANSRQVLLELEELSRDLQQVLRNVDTLHCQTQDGGEIELPGLGDAREQVEALLWHTGTLLFWSNYSIKSNVVA